MKPGRVIGLAVVMAISLVCKGSNDSLKTRECLALYQDDLNAKNYQAALQPLEWLLQNKPGLHKKIYIDAVTLYHEMATKETDQDLKHMYEQKVFESYMQRVKYFGEKDKVFNYMFFKAYAYYRDQPDRYGYLINVYDTTFWLNGTKIFDANILGYIDLLLLAERESDINREDVFFRLMDLDKHFSYKMEADSVFGSRYRSLTQRVIENIEWSCEEIENLFFWSGVKPNELLSRIVWNKNCTDSEIYYESILKTARKKPSFTLYFYLGNLDTEKNQWDQAGRNYETAMELSTDLYEKSKAALARAQIAYVQGQFLKSYEYARKSLKLNPTQEANELLGDLFFNSYSKCKMNESEIYDRLCFIIAHRYYKEAGNKDKIAITEKQLPSTALLFQHGYYSGDKMKFDCWIKQEVILLEK